jgi:hypothetical protein
MVNVLSVLILSSGFLAAVETSDGFVEKSFVNSPAGVEAFLDWTEPLVMREKKDIKICTVTLGDDSGSVMAWLMENDMRPALLSPTVYREHVAASGLKLESATSAARACLAKFPFLRKVG